MFLMKNKYKIVKRIKKTNSKYWKTVNEGDIIIVSVYVEGGKAGRCSIKNVTQNTKSSEFANVTAGQLEKLELDKMCEEEE